MTKAEKPNIRGIPVAVAMYGTLDWVVPYSSLSDDLPIHEAHVVLYAEKPLNG